jgi:diguanylate cyclase (GGDEF)-like protein
MALQACAILCGLIVSLVPDWNPTPFYEAALFFLFVEALFVTRHAVIARLAPPPPQRARDATPAVTAQEFVALDRRIEEIVEQARRLDRRVAVFAVEIEGLDEVEVEHGPEVLERLLHAAFQRLVSCARTEDVVMRLSREKFGIIFLDAPSGEALAQKAERIVETLGSPFLVMSFKINIAARLGVGAMQDRPDDPHALAHRAEAALHRAQRLPRQRYSIFSEDPGADAEERARLERDLAAAIRGDGLDIAYQPIVDATTGATVGVEALCRWRHPTRGEMSPSKFIPIAESNGDIKLLGEWILRQACKDARAWPNLKVAVNVSPYQFRSQGFVELVQEVLDETGLDPRRLELELTETVLVSEMEETVEALHRLKELGLRLALDDFGTGYSSLNYLLSLPFDKLKIDRSFVLKLEAGSCGLAIVHSIVSLGRALGLHVTAEGVDSAEQQQFLRIAGVHSFQGYRFGKPMASDAIAERLIGERADRAQPTSIAV